MLRKLLLVCLLLLAALFVPIAGSAGGNPVACWKQCMIEGGCGPGVNDPYCAYLSESCHCDCGPPEWCP